MSHLGISLFLISTFFFLSPVAEAQLSCPERAIEQVTSTTENGSYTPSINADGTRVAFVSESNIGGGNPDGNFEVYLFDSRTGITTQITDTTEPFGNIGPSINADGTKIAFASNALDGGGGNPEENFQIYIYDTDTGTFTQITDTTGGTGSVFPSINSNGTRIAFVSTTDINGGNPDESFEIYLFDTNTGIFTQITSNDGANETPSINADGTRIVFATDADINGGNPDGNFDIYLFDTTLGFFTQITSVDEDSTDPSINADGTKIALVSDADITGGNPDGYSQIFLFDTNTGVYTQITSEDGDSGGPSINADGTNIAFGSVGNINGGNPDGFNQVYHYDTSTGIFTQITSQDGDGGDISINDDGTRIAFRSDANINGGNPDENDEIFLASCFDPTKTRPIPTMSEWGMIATAGVLGIVGFFALRRRTVQA